MDYPQRKHPRADWHDYNRGLYFVTFCVRDKKHDFGQIHDGVMHYTTIGEEAERQMHAIASHYPDVNLLAGVVMPNHMHMVLTVDNPCGAENTANAIDGQRSLGGRQSRLAHVINGFKGSITRYARQNRIDFAWQSGFHDHIIRHRAAYENIMAYVTQNVARWGEDCFNPNAAPHQ